GRMGRMGRRERMGRMGRRERRERRGRRGRNNSVYSLHSSVSNSIHFSPEKAEPRLTHNLSIMPKFYVKKDVVQQ
ncbi:hypothetical protein, partial [Okeania sp. SIO3I5]|uniref:hypothetical protein n=1 Tax=Okeania sp. SIO3I5 TaxID=2607805 RepID=UPI0025D080DB